MLEYVWGNPSTIMLTGDDNPPDTALNRHILDPYATHNFNESSSHFFNPNTQYDTTQDHNQHHHHHHHHHQQQQQQPPQPFIGSHHFHQSIYDPLAIYGESSYGHQSSLLSLEPAGPTSFVMVPKSEPIVRGGIDYSNVGRIGLNLGGRTYFASSEDEFVSRLYRRSRIVEPGPVNSPRCQAEGCHADLSNAKHYHRRHKVCEFHSKAATVISAGLTQRFCQQCSRFHILSEFDNGKRSCRKRLADHNRRRRKSQPHQQPPALSLDQEHPNKSPPHNIAPNSPKNISRSPAESGAHSSSVTVAVSPPRITLDRFRQRSYQLGNNSTASASSLFFSNE